MHPRFLFVFTSRGNRGTAAAKAAAAACFKPQFGAHPRTRVSPLSPPAPARDAAFPWKRAEKAGLLSTDHQSGIYKSCNGLTKSGRSLDLIFIIA